MKIVFNLVVWIGQHQYRGSQCAEYVIVLNIGCTSRTFFNTLITPFLHFQLASLTTVFHTEVSDM